LGLCGILAQKLQATEVVLTDGDSDTLENLRENVQRNIECSSASVQCPQLIWGHGLDKFHEMYKAPFDVMIGADIMYVPKVLQPLWETIDKLLSASGKFLMAYARRNVPIESVLEHATKHGFEWTCPKKGEGVFVFTRIKTSNPKRSTMGNREIGVTF
jgi:predicted nicotinamide N-methyase